jgi:hypothetical protein
MVALPASQLIGPARRAPGPWLMLLGMGVTSTIPRVVRSARAVGLGVSPPQPRFLSTVAHALCSGRFRDWVPTNRSSSRGPNACPPAAHRCADRPPTRSGPNTGVAACACLRDQVVRSSTNGTCRSSPPSADGCGQGGETVALSGRRVHPCAGPARRFGWHWNCAGTSTWRPGPPTGAVCASAGARRSRLARHLFELATTRGRRGQRRCACPVADRERLSDHAAARRLGALVTGLWHDTAPAGHRSLARAGVGAVRRGALQSARWSTGLLGQLRATGERDVLLVLAAGWRLTRTRAAGHRV